VINEPVAFKKISSSAWSSPAESRRGLGWSKILWLGQDASSNSWDVRGKTSWYHYLAINKPVALKKCLVVHGLARQSRVVGWGDRKYCNWAKMTRRIVGVYVKKYHDIITSSSEGLCPLRIFLTVCSIAAESHHGLQWWHALNLSRASFCSDRTCINR